MSLLSKKYTSPQFTGSIGNFYNVGSQIIKQTTEIDPEKILQAATSEDIVAEQVELEIEELTTQLNAIETLKKVEKPLKKRLQILNSFLAKLKDAQDAIREVDVNIKLNEVPEDVYVEDFMEPQMKSSLPPTPKSPIPVNASIESSEEDLTEHRLQDFL